MTRKKEQAKLHKKFRKIGIPSNEALILARELSLGLTLEGLCSTKSNLTDFGGDTSSYSPTHMDALDRIEATIGPDGCFWDPKIVGPKGFYKPSGVVVLVATEEKHDAH